MSLISRTKLLGLPSIYLLAGIFVVSPVISFPIGGNYVTMFTVFLLLIIGDLLRTLSNRYSSNRIVHYFFCWSFFGVISSLFGFLYFSDLPEFQKAAVSYLPKILIFCFILVLFLKQCSEVKVNNFGRGVLIGAIINMVAAFLDTTLFYSTGISYINKFFSGYIELNGEYSLGIYTNDGYFRSAGFNSDQACIGLYSAFIAAYSFYVKKPMLIIFSILGNIGAVSLVGVVSVFLVIILHIKDNIKVAVRFSLLAIIMALFLLNSNNEFISSISDPIRSRIEMKQNTANDNDNARAMYWKTFIPAVLNSPSSLILGTGYCTASYAYYSIGIKRVVKRPYDPEQTYFAYFFDIGLIGLMYMLLLYYNLYKSLRRIQFHLYKTNAGLYASYIEGTLISYLGYHYTLGASEMMMLICGIVISAIYQLKYT